ncbi:MAG: hypothetical protein WDW36_002830 [Sanguina aurantia]
MMQALPSLSLIILSVSLLLPSTSAAAWNSQQHPLSGPLSLDQDPLASVLSPLSQRYHGAAAKDMLEGGSLLSSRQSSSSTAPRRDPYVATVFSNSSSIWMPRLAEDSDPHQLNLTRANLFAHFTAIAYCSIPDLLVQWNCTRCKQIAGFQPVSVVRDSRWNLLAYIGYYSPPERHRRITCTPSRRPPHALIHAGFYSLWAQSELLPGVTQAVAGLLVLHPDAALYSVGHSMGAAVAQLCALDMKFMYNISHVGCYTYGAPRVGNQAYQELFNLQIAESWRFTHGRDIVPSVPLQYMGFHHVSNEVWLVDVESSAGSETKVLMCDESGEDPSCHNSACYLGLCTSVMDHLTYMGNVAMYQDGPQC